MGFKPSRSLIEADLFVTSYFQSGAENYKSGKKEAPASKRVCDFAQLIAGETDPQNKLLIRFYAKLIEFDQTKYAMKSDEMGEDSVAILTALENSVIDLLREIRNEEDLWGYLIKNNTGRRSLYLLINSRTIRQKGVESSFWVLDEFLKSNTVQNIKQVLEYLKFNL